MLIILLVSLILIALPFDSLGLAPFIGSRSIVAIDHHAVTVNDSPKTSRRNLLAIVSVALTATPSLAANAAESAEVRGTKITPFNSLMFQYRGSDFGGLDENDLQPGQASISYADFIESMKAGQVERVEFQAPDGDVAYCFLKEKTIEPIRIGRGYPIEQHDGYSSPLFAVRAVKNANVPYKFVVPALAKVNN